MFFLFTAGILTIGYFSYRSCEKNFRDETEHQLSSIGDLEVYQLDIFLSEDLRADLPEPSAQQNSGVLLPRVNDKYYREVEYMKR
jgi:hypothetical protein